jgi:hypothetical protein
MIFENDQATLTVTSLMPSPMSDRLNWTISPSTAEAWKCLTVAKNRGNAAVGWHGRGGGRGTTGPVAQGSRKEEAVAVLDRSFQLGWLDSCSRLTAKRCWKSVKKLTD